MTFVAHVGSIVVFAFPFTYNRIVNFYTSSQPSGIQVLSLWALFSVFVITGIFASFKKINSQLLNPSPKIIPQKTPPSASDTSSDQVSTLSSKLTTLKAFSLFPAILFLSSFSVVNFSFIVFCTLLFVPIVTVLGHPRPKSNILAKVQTMLLLVVNPLALILVGAFVKGSLESLLSDNLRYSTLFFPFIGLVYLPVYLYR